MNRTLLILACLAPVAFAAPSLQIEATGAPELTLRGKDAKQQLIVTAKLDGGALRDLPTRRFTRSLQRGF